MLGLAMYAFFALVIFLIVVTGRWMSALAKKRGIGRNGQLIAAVAGGISVYVAFFWKQVPSTALLIYYCNTDSGTKIYRTAENVDGFLGVGGSREIFDAGYEYVVDGGYGAWYQYFRDDSQRAGWRREETNSLPRYEVRSVHSRGYFVNRGSFQIFDRKMNEVMAEQVSFYFPRADADGWSFFTQYWLRFGNQCSMKGSPVGVEYFKSVIKPAKQD